jgi:hypothetical protein
MSSGLEDTSEAHASRRRGCTFSNALIRSDCSRFAAVLVLLLALRPQSAWTEPKQTTVQPSKETLQGKLIVGYQGWFVCPDSSHLPPGKWVHWMKNGEATVDMLPDPTELTASERCATPWTSRAGQTVDVYTAQNPMTVDRHFAWMQEYGIDGAALQRFATELGQTERKVEIHQVLANVVSAAEHHDRSFFVEYDLTGTQDRRGIDRVIADWSALEAQGIGQSRAYQRHRGHIVVGVFGLGFAGSRYVTADLAEALIDGLRKASLPYGGITIFAGVPADWRTLSEKGAQSSEWAKVYRSVDVISPWTVGRYNSAETIDTFRRDHLEPDVLEAKRIGVDYMPVIFPGFSWHNLWTTRGDDNRPTNQIPRDCGRFYWRQFFNAVDVGNSMIFSAMFDEVDEGTAIFKTRATQNELPASPPFLSLDADGCRLPSDWYLRVAGSAASVLHGTAPNNSRLPLTIPR